VEAIRQVGQRLYLGDEPAVLGPKRFRHVLWQGLASPTRPTRQRPERVQDSGRVDRFLKHCASHGRQQTEGREAHRDERQRHPGHHALDCDAARAVGDVERLQ